MTDAMRKIKSMSGSHTRKVESGKNFISIHLQAGNSDVSVRRANIGLPWEGGAAHGEGHGGGFWGVCCSYAASCSEWWFY